MKLSVSMKDLRVPAIRELLGRNMVVLSVLRNRTTKTSRYFQEKIEEGFVVCDLSLDDISYYSRLGKSAILSAIEFLEEAKLLIKLSTGHKDGYIVGTKNSPVKYFNPDEDFVLTRGYNKNINDEYDLLKFTEELCLQKNIKYTIGSADSKKVLLDLVDTYKLEQVKEMIVYAIDNMDELGLNFISIQGIYTYRRHIIQGLKDDA